MDKAARGREEIILKQLEEKDPLPDKEKDQMGMGKSCQSAQSDCGRDYPERIDLCLNECGEVAECDLIVV